VLAKVVVVLPALGDHSVQSVSSDGCIGSSKFHTVTLPEPLPTLIRGDEMLRISSRGVTVLP